MQHALIRPKCNKKGEGTVVPKALVPSVFYCIFGRIGASRIFGEKVPLSFFFFENPIFGKIDQNSLIIQNSLNIHEAKSVSHIGTLQLLHGTYMAARFCFMNN